MSASRGIAVVSGRAPASFADSATNHRIYAEHHNYCYVETSWFTSESNRYLNKIHYILHVLPHFKYVFWVDDDAFFTRLDAGIEEFLPRGEHFVSLAWSSDHDRVDKHLATGSMIIRQCQDAFDWLLASLRLEMQQVQSLWQSSWGYFSGGDQDLLIYLLRTRYCYSYNIVRYPIIQGRIQDLKDGGDLPLVTHLTGTYLKKLKKYIALTKMLGNSRHALGKSSDTYIDDHVLVLYRLWTVLARAIVAIRVPASRPQPRL